MESFKDTIAEWTIASLAYIIAIIVMIVAAGGNLLQIIFGRILRFF